MLEIRSLRKTFRPGWLEKKTGSEVVAVRDVTLSIQGGEILGLVGESGSGKSTLANCVLGLESPDRGEILFQGKPLTPAQRKRLRGQIQAIFQDPDGSLNPRMTVEQIIREPLDILHLGASPVVREKVSESMDRVGLPSELGSSLPTRLSGGQKQRVAIARALAADPKLLVADEPVSALDVSVQAQILNLLGLLREQLGLTILLISHDLNVVGQVCDRVAVMVRGGLVEVAPSELLFRSARHVYTQSLLASIVPVDPAEVNRWAKEDIPGWEGIPGRLREVAPGHWVAQD